MALGSHPHRQPRSRHVQRRQGYHDDNVAFRDRLVDFGDSACRSCDRRSADRFSQRLQSDCTANPRTFSVASVAGVYFSSMDCRPDCRCAPLVPSEPACLSRRPMDCPSSFAAFCDHGRQRRRAYREFPLPEALHARGIFLPVPDRCLDIHAHLCLAIALRIGKMCPIAHGSEPPPRRCQDGTGESRFQPTIPLQRSGRGGV